MIWVQINGDVALNYFALDFTHLHQTFSWDAKRFRSCRTFVVKAKRSSADAKISEERRVDVTSIVVFFFFSDVVFLNL